MAYNGHDRADRIERSERLVSAMLLESRRMVATVQAYQTEMDAHYAAMARLFADAAAEHGIALAVMRRVKRAKSLEAAHAHVDAYLRGIG